MCFIYLFIYCWHFASIVQHKKSERGKRQESALRERKGTAEGNQTRGTRSTSRATGMHLIVFFCSCNASRRVCYDSSASRSAHKGYVIKGWKPYMPHFPVVYRVDSTPLRSTITVEYSLNVSGVVITRRPQSLVTSFVCNTTQRSLRLAPFRFFRQPPSTKMSLLVSV